MLIKKQIIYRLIILLLGITLAGCPRFTPLTKNSPHRGTNTLKPLNKGQTHHRVAKGDTLYSIAFSFDRDVRDVARWNNIKRPYTIYPGQKLRVVPIASDSKNKRTASKSNRNSVKKKWQPKSRPASTYARKVSWRWPTSGKVLSSFSYKDPGRRGIEIGGNKGQPVYAAADGTVVYKGNGLRGYGNLIILKHNDTYFSAYAHTDDVVVKEDEKVKLGQKLADMGTTSSNKTVLHFEIRRNGKPVNPLRYLPSRR